MHRHNYFVVPTLCLYFQMVAKNKDFLIDITIWTYIAPKTCTIFYWVLYLYYKYLKI